MAAMRRVPGPGRPASASVRSFASAIRRRVRGGTRAVEWRREGAGRDRHDAARAEIRINHLPPGWQYYFSTVPEPMPGHPNPGARAPPEAPVPALLNQQSP